MDISHTNRKRETYVTPLHQKWAVRPCTATVPGTFGGVEQQPELACMGGGCRSRWHGMAWQYVRTPYPLGRLLKRGVFPFGLLKPQCSEPRKPVSGRALRILTERGTSSGTVPERVTCNYLTQFTCNSCTSSSHSICCCFCCVTSRCSSHPADSAASSCCAAVRGLCLHHVCCSVLHCRMA